MFESTSLTKEKLIEARKMLEEDPNYKLQRLADLTEALSVNLDRFAYCKRNNDEKSAYIYANLVKRLAAECEILEKELVETV